MLTKTPNRIMLLETLRSSLSDLQSVRLVNVDDPQFAALKKDLQRAVSKLERSHQVATTKKMRELAVKMRERAKVMRELASG